MRSAEACVEIDFDGEECTCRRVAIIEEGGEVG